MNQKLLRLPMRPLVCASDASGCGLFSRIVLVCYVLLLAIACPASARVFNITLALRLSATSIAVPPVVLSSTTLAGAVGASSTVRTLYSSASWASSESLDAARGAQLAVDDANLAGVLSGGDQFAISALIDDGSISHVASNSSVPLPACCRYFSSESLASQSSASVSSLASSVVTAAVTSSQLALATVGFTCANMASLAGKSLASSGAGKLFLPLATTTLDQSDSSAFPSLFRVADYRPDVVAAIAQALVGLVFYFDWTKIGVVWSDDASSVQLWNAFNSLVFAPSGPVYDSSASAFIQTALINAQTESLKRLKTGSVSALYDTIRGSSTGMLNLPLLLDMYSTQVLQSANLTSASLSQQVADLVSSYQQQDIRVILFLGTMGITRAIGRAMFAAGLYGAGFAIILAPHLASSELIDSVELNSVFSGALALRTSNLASKTFRRRYSALFGSQPSEAALVSYDAVNLIINATARVQNTCADPTLLTCIASAIRSSSSVRGVLGDLSFAPSSNNVVGTNSSAAPRVLLCNLVDQDFVDVGAFDDYRMNLGTAPMFPGLAASAPRQYRVGFVFSSTFSMPSPAPTDYMYVQQSAQFALSLLRQRDFVGPQSTKESKRDSVVLVRAFVIDDGLNVASASTATDFSSAVKSAFSLMLTLRPPIAILGPGFSTSAALLTARMNALALYAPGLFFPVPLLSFGSVDAQTAPLLKRDQYPYFSQLGFSLDAEVQIAFAGASRLGFKRFGLVYNDNGPGAAALKSAATALRIQALASQYNAYVDPDAVFSWPTNVTYSQIRQTFERLASLNVSVSFMLLYYESMCALVAPSYDTNITATTQFIFLNSFSNAAKQCVSVPAMYSSVPNTWLVVSQSTSPVYVIGMYDPSATAFALFNQMDDKLRSQFPYNAISGRDLPFACEIAFDSVFILKSIIGSAARMSIDLNGNPAGFQSLLRNPSALAPLSFSTGNVRFPADSNQRLGVTGFMSFLLLYRYHQLGINNGLALAIMGMGTESSSIARPPDWVLGLTDPQPQKFPFMTYGRDPLSSCPAGMFLFVNRNTSAPGMLFDIVFGTCLPCPVGTYSRVNTKSSCISCPENSVCPLMSAQPLFSPDNVLFDPASNDAVIPSGALASPASVTAISYKYLYISAGCVGILLAFFIAVFFLQHLFCSSLKEKGADFLKSIDFFMMSHTKEVGEPLMMRPRSIGGLFTILFAIGALISLFFFLEQSWVDSFDVISTSSAGLGALFTMADSAMSPLRLTVWFVGIDRVAACADLCSTPGAFSLVGGGFSDPSSTPPAQPSCDFFASNSSCRVNFVTIETVRVLPRTMSINVVLSNTVAQGIYFNLTMLSLLGRPVGMRGSILPQTNAVLQGPLASQVSVLAQGYMFTGDARADSTLAPLLAGGYLALKVQQLPGSQMLASQFPARQAAAMLGNVSKLDTQVAFSLSIERSASLSASSLFFKASTSTLISNISAFIVSFVLTVLQSGMLLFEFTFDRFFRTKARKSVISLMRSNSLINFGEGAPLPIDVTPAISNVCAPNDVNTAPDAVLSTSNETDDVAAVELAPLPPAINRSPTPSSGGERVLVRRVYSSTQVGASERHRVDGTPAASLIQSADGSLDVASFGENGTPPLPVTPTARPRLPPQIAARRSMEPFFNNRK